MASVNISGILNTATEIYNDICNQLIDSNTTAQLVRIRYAPIWEASATSQFPEWGNASINGTPNLSPNGNSQKQIEVTEEIRMRVYSSEATGFGRSIFRKLAGTKYVEGQLLTIGLMTDYKKVANSVRADFYLGTEATTGIRSYKLATEIHPHGFGKDKFFFCFWEKA